MGPGGLEQRRLRESGSLVPSVISPTIWRAGQRVGGHKAGRVLMVERAASSVSKPSAQRVRRLPPSCAESASVSQPEVDPLAPGEEETHTGRPEVTDGDPLIRARVTADPTPGVRRSLSPAILIPSRLDDTDIIPAWSVLSQIQELLERPLLVLGRARRHQESGLPR